MRRWRWRAAALALALGGWWWSRPPPPAPVVTPSMLAARPPAPVVPVRPPAPEPRPGRRPWDASVRCAFVSLLRRRGDETRYAAFLESAHRVQDAFRLERRYPHVVFHEGDIPEGHVAALRVFPRTDLPPAAFWSPAAYRPPLPVAELFADPKHPYTEILVGSNPEPDPNLERSRPSTAIQGEIPSPVNVPAGCRFANRCPKAMDVCRNTTPELIALEDADRLVACHLYSKLVPG